MLYLLLESLNLVARLTVVLFFLIMTWYGQAMQALRTHVMACGTSVQHLSSRDLRTMWVAPSAQSSIGKGLDKVYMCHQCSLCFTRLLDLSNHQRFMHDGDQNRNRSKKRKRKSYTAELRTRAAAMYESEMNTNPIGARDRVCDHFGITAGSTLSSWMDEFTREFTAHECASGRSEARRHRPYAAKWPEAEMMLYARFMWRRKFQKLSVSQRWLKNQMKDILRNHYGAVIRTLSNGWVCNFQRRFGITQMCRTNKHKQSVQTRLPLIRQFHQYIRGLLNSAPQRCPLYGRFPPHRVFAMDQVPLSFSALSKRSLNKSGEACAVREQHTDKRFCTLQITICADPSKCHLVPMEIYFRGQGNVSQEEKDFYDQYPNVKVRWQRNAWADESVMVRWFLDFRTATLSQGEVMLVLDRHGPHKTSTCLQFMETVSVVPVFSPPNCTDCVSPVDCNVGANIKKYIKEQYDLMDSECTNITHITDSQKRKLLVKWASEAWTHLIQNEPTTIVRSFVKTGVLVRKDGSQDNEIKLDPKDPQSYTVTTPPGPHGEFNFS